MSSSSSQSNSQPTPYQLPRSPVKHTARSSSPAADESLESDSMPPPSSISLRRSTRVRRAPHRFAPSHKGRPHNRFCEVAGIHQEMLQLVGLHLVRFYLVSWVGCEGGWTYLAKPDLKCSRMIRQYMSNYKAALNDRQNALKPFRAPNEVAAVHGNAWNLSGENIYLLSCIDSDKWEWATERDCSDYTAVKLYKSQKEQAFKEWKAQQPKPIVF